MKKYLSILAITAVASSVLAQGTINFKNDSTSLIKQWTTPTDSTAINVAAGNGHVQLAWAPSTVTAFTPWTPSMNATAWLAANPGWTLLGDATQTGTINPLAGRFSGITLTAATTPAGASINAVVLGWTGSFTSFDAAYAAGGTTMVGISGKFTVATGDPTAQPIPGTPGLLTPGFTGMTLQPVPEPSTFALAGLGAAALLIFRRRN